MSFQFLGQWTEIQIFLSSDVNFKLICDQFSYGQISFQTCRPADRWRSNILSKSSQNEGSCILCFVFCFCLFLLLAFRLVLYVGFATTRGARGIPAIFLNKPIESVIETCPSRLSFPLWHMPLLTECLPMLSFPSFTEREKNGESGKKHIFLIFIHSTKFVNCWRLEQRGGVVEWCRGSGI